MTTPNLFTSLGKSMVDILKNQDRDFVEYLINVQNEESGKLIKGA
jgi:predicted RNA-binding protein YlqC (UPF0109 family)